MDLLSYVLPKRTLPEAPEGAQNMSQTDLNRLGPKEVYLAWTAPGRAAHKGYNEKLMRSFAIIGVFIALFLVILQEYLLILVVVSMIFVGQVLAKTPPLDAKYEINTYGIMVDDQIFYWHQMRRFFFMSQDGVTTLAVDLLSGFPSRLFLNIISTDLPKIKELLGSRLQFLESAPETLLDRTYNSVAGKFTS